MEKSFADGTEYVSPLTDDTLDDNILKYEMNSKSKIRIGKEAACEENGVCSFCGAVLSHRGGTGYYCRTPGCKGIRN